MCGDVANEVSRSLCKRKDLGNPEDMCRDGANEASRSPRERKDSRNPEEMCGNAANEVPRSPRLRTHPATPAENHEQGANEPPRSPLVPPHQPPTPHQLLTQLAPATGPACGRAHQAPNRNPASRSRRAAAGQACSSCGSRSFSALTSQS